MNQSYTKNERSHIERIKMLPCSVCDKPGPSEAHHIDQSCPWTCIPLCKDCHTGSITGLHGQKANWKIKKVDELKALGVTIKRLLS